MNGKGDARSHGQVTLEEEAGEDDGIAGPELPPDIDIEVPEDEEGRFFGGGITNNTAEVLDFIDEQEQDSSVVSGDNWVSSVPVEANSTLQKQEKVDSAWVRRLALNFERRISKNAELRAKFEGEPQKYVYHIRNKV